MTPAQLRSAAREVEKLNARLQELPLRFRDEAREIEARLDALGRELAREYGRRHGWRISRYPSTVRELARGERSIPARYARSVLRADVVDHPVFYCDSQGRPAAIVGFNYGQTAAARLVAAKLGLGFRIEKQFPNWHSMNTKFIVLFRKPISHNVPPGGAISGERAAKSPQGVIR
jgi:hypothetical protein